MVIIKRFKDIVYVGAANKMSST